MNIIETPVRHGFQDQVMEASQGLFDRLLGLALGILPMRTLPAHDLTLLSTMDLLREVHPGGDVVILTDNLDKRIYGNKRFLETLREALRQEVQVSIIFDVAKSINPEDTLRVLREASTYSKTLDRAGGLSVYSTSETVRYPFMVVDRRHLRVEQMLADMRPSFTLFDSSKNALQLLSRTDSLIQHAKQVI